MEIKALEELLGIRAPWRVADITVDVALQEVVVRVECEPTEWCNTQRRLHVHGWEKRRWRHLEVLPTSPWDFSLGDVALASPAKTRPTLQLPRPTRPQPVA